MPYPPVHPDEWNNIVHDKRILYLNLVKVQHIISAGSYDSSPLEFEQVLIWRVVERTHLSQGLVKPRGGKDVRGFDTLDKGSESLPRKEIPAFLSGVT